VHSCFLDTTTISPCFWQQFYASAELHCELKTAFSARLALLERAIAKGRSLCHTVINNLSQ